MRHAVVIAGGGPTGLMLAGELALAGIDVAIVERRESQALVGSRAGGLHARSLEVLDQRGIVERFVSQGTRHPVVHFHIPLSITDFPTRHNYVLGLWQNHIERILADWVGEQGVPIYRGREVTGFTQDDDGVGVELSEGQSIRAQYLVGCDGGRSLIRKAAGIDFPGWDPTTSWLLAEVDMTEEPQWGFRHDAVGTHAIGKLEEGPVRIRLVLTEREVPRHGRKRESSQSAQSLQSPQPPQLEQAPPTLRDVSEALIAVYGTDFGVHNPHWITRFTDMTRQAASYRDRRVLLAGDAAHVHPPVGGHGLNMGLQDAVNLGWKLAQVIKQTSPASLLDTYHAERHPVAARVLRNTMAHVALRRQDDRTKALGEYMSELLNMDGPRKRLVGEMSALDVHYDFGDPTAHPLLGRRMPDLDIVPHTTTSTTLTTTNGNDNGPLQVFTLLHHARPVLLNFGEPHAFDADIAPWADRVQSIDATYDGPWELPVIGPVAAPTAVLIRPDGYVAWVKESALSLTDALTTWFGPSAPAASMPAATAPAVP